MGDTGSMFLGYSCATLIILLAQERPKWFLASMVMFALPVLDTVLAVARRYIAGRPVFSADRMHFHHQLVSRGFTVRKTVVIIYGIAISFALLGSAIVFMRTRYAVAIYLVVFGSIIVTAYKMGMVHERPRVVKAGGIDVDERVTPTRDIDPNTVLEIEDPRKKEQKP
jgi:UDP-GlcNAc:undecaprenyl-phosphate GlcNAc-1-phosphate transferase